MAKQEEFASQGSSTNALLAQILNVAQDSNTTLKLLLGSSKNLEDSNNKILVASIATTKAIQQLLDAIIGGESHVFTVKVEQLAKELAKHLKK